MTALSVNSARIHLGEILARAERGQVSTIGPLGEPLIRIVPLAPVHDEAASLHAMRKIREYARTHPVPGITNEELKSWIDEGRA